ncbi:MAG: hypothetical protein CR996_00085 [Draconibacterium sp.]|nr:MAG: hypothetical protein CR996_00085 [Draconibacterium sp.]
MIFHQNTAIMHNMKSKFNIFSNITKSVFENRIDCNDNFFPYRRRPKLSYCQIIAFAITDESLGIDSELFLWAKIKNEHAGCCCA